MPRKRLRPGHTAIPDHAEFEFLHDYPPLAAEQQKELTAVVTLLEAWEQSRAGSSRKDEEAAYIKFQQGLGEFKAKLPGAPIAAMRALCGQGETVIEMLKRQRRVDFKSLIEFLWERWREWSHALGTPPAPRAIANAADALHAIDDLSRQLDAVHIKSSEEINPEAAMSTASAPGAAAAEQPVDKQPSPPELTTADSVSRWAKAFGVSRNTMARMLSEGTVRNKRLSAKSYQIAIEDLPAKEQEKHRPQKGK
jgi:hypothetical protein